MKHSIPVYIFCLLACIFGINTLQAQKCYTNEYLENLKIHDPQRYANMMAVREKLSHMQAKETDEIYTIPVVVHVVYNHDYENLPDDRIYTQIFVLNEDFSRTNDDTINTPGSFQDVAANCNIQFCLASFDPNGDSTTGIIRVASDSVFFPMSRADNVKFTALGGDDAWPCSSYLNIWVCNLQENVLGYAVMASDECLPEDGIVIDYKNFGLADVTSKPYDLGRTATHEIGHWLGLYHTWGDDGSSCEQDDGIDDTPMEEDASYGCPSFPKTDSCTTEFPGVMFMNYMDYTDDDCMNIFTEGQKEKMRLTLETQRASILTSAAGCNAIEPLPGDIAELLVYPVPTNGQFTISIKNFVGYNDHFDIRIYNALGQLITTANPVAANNVGQYFDIRGLATGCYFVSVFNGTYFLNGEFLMY